MSNATDRSIAVYKPSKKSVKVNRASIKTQQLPKEDEGLLHIVQGKIVDSVQEWRLAKALEQLNVAYIYQVEVHGGRAIAGGQVLDFLIYAPFAIPVPVMGKYWHSRTMGMYDRWKLDILKQIFGREPLAVSEDELESIEEAILWVRRNIL